MDFKNVTLEMSLKPFRDTSEETARDVCRHLFEQWMPLLRHAEQVSVLLWCSDGSEVLDYAGDPDAPFEWARYIGRANAKRPAPGDPDGVALWSRSYLYCDDPPTFTYGWLKRLVAAIKEVGAQVTGLPVRVGETFDPGPEFAESSFKYERHPEVCAGTTMGEGSFVCCYAQLHGDDRPYAGFPDGIPEGTPFGTFFGRQCQHFLSDLGFDYIWFSNGFGFGTETWALRGVLFDGRRFSAEPCARVRRENLAFWQQFRAECPDYPIETRGTNLSTGMDLSSDAVPLSEIYRGGFGLEPPPNSPWAAINGDFGIELVGWMSHIAEIPGETFPFRFYTHDPWWLNSPWLDRYGREPHDIYLPLAVSRIDEKGAVRTPTACQFLTADDSYGRLPDQVPNEVIAHILTARRDGPDGPGPLVWVYPFDEYHDWTFGPEPRLEEVFFGDWFMRGAVSHGLPLNTVISTRALRTVLDADASRLAGSILVSPVPDADGAWERALMSHVQAGGSLILYGPVLRAGERTLEMLNLRRADALSGEFGIELASRPDVIEPGLYADRLAHHELLSAGGVCAVPADGSDPATHVLASMRQDAESRVAALWREPSGPRRGAVAWVRGTVACDPEKTGGHLLVPLDPRECFPAEVLMRCALGALGIELKAELPAAAGGGGAEFELWVAAHSDPMLCIARRRNGYFFSGHCPDTTVRQHMRFPQGAPLFLGLDALLVEGRSTYVMPPAWHRECRVFIDGQEDGVVSCREQCSSEIGLERRLLVRGLSDATVRFYPDTGSEDRVTMLRDPRWPFVAGDFLTPALHEGPGGRWLEVEGVSGDLLISW